MTTKRTEKSRLWNVGLWIAQVALAAMFLMVGMIKALTPVGGLSGIMPMARAVMILAMIFHVSKGEYAIGTNLGLAMLAAFILFGRFYKVPIAAREGHAVARN